MPALSRERILRTAVALADSEGLAAVTLRRLAAELGVHVTSLYHHVATRDAVTDGMAAMLVAEADLPTEPVGWEQWVRRFFTALGDVAERHPGAFAVLQLRPVQGPEATATFETALAAFERAGLSPHDAYAAVKATTLLTMGAALERTLAAFADDASASTAVDALPPEDFPRVRALEEVADPSTTYAFSLEVLVSGLRSQVRRRPS